MTLSTFRPRKSLGQNFLVDENIARKIIRAVAPKPDETIVEIGPGFGVLTKYLIESANRVVAVEIDRKLAAGLEDRFADHPNFELVHADFLKTDLIELVGRSRPFRIVGNIPYHITSPVIFKAFEHREVIKDMVLMIQREVAMRIVSAPDSKNYGILSVFSQLFSVPSIAFHVSRNVFKPKPDVDSTVIQWNFSASQQPSFKDVNLFKKLVKTTFQQRRKMLRTSLRNDSCFAEQVPGLDFDLKRRPENLRPEEFVYLANQMSG